MKPLPTEINSTNFAVENLKPFSLAKFWKKLELALNIKHMYSKTIYKISGSHLRTESNLFQCSNMMQCCLF